MIIRLKMWPLERTQGKQLRTHDITIANSDHFVLRPGDDVEDLHKTTTNELTNTGNFVNGLKSLPFMCTVHKTAIFETSEVQSLKLQIKNS